MDRDSVYHLPVEENRGQKGNASKPIKKHQIEKAERDERLTDNIRVLNFDSRSPSKS